MKKFENLGKKLSKEEQKKIIGGVGDACDCGCTNDLQCGTMVCSNLVSLVVCPGTTCYPRNCVPREP
jgi:hypothetical protein